MSTFVLPGLPEYGAADLKSVYQKYFIRALIVAGAIHLAGIGIYWGTKSTWRTSRDSAWRRSATSTGK